MGEGRIESRRRKGSRRREATQEDGKATGDWQSQERESLVSHSSLSCSSLTQTDDAIDDRAERKETVSSTQTAKIAKRNSNLAARVKQAKDKKAGIKTKSKMVKTVSKAFANRDKSGGRPGFK